MFTTSSSIPELQNELLALGLSERDASIYLHLLIQGTPLGATKIALGLSMPRQNVYLGIASLLEQGLIAKVPHGKQCRYQAEPPSALEKRARRTYVRASTVAETLLKISPLGHDQDFEVLVGERAIQQHQMDFVRDAEVGETQHIIGGSADEFITLMGDLYEEMLAIQEKKKFVTYYIGHKSEDAPLSPYRASKVSFHAKLLPDIPKGFLQFTVRRNTVEFYSLSGTPPILYIMKSERVANDFRAFFDMLWSMAREPREEEIQRATE